DGLTVAVRQPHATYDGRLHVLVFGALRPLALAAAFGCAAWASECAGRSAALSRTPAPTGATAKACAGRRTAAARAAATVVPTATPAGASACRRAGATTTWAGTPAAGTGPTGGHAAAGPGRHVAGRRTGARSARTRCAGPGGLRARNRPFDRLGAGERVVADARRARRGLGRGTGPWGAGS